MTYGLDRSTQLLWDACNSKGMLVLGYVVFSSPRTGFGPGVAYRTLERSYEIDLDADGKHDVSIYNPEFSVSALNTNAVLAWEYRPGSTLYAAWSQGRSGYRDNGLFQPRRELRELFGVATDPSFPRTNAFMIKMSYRLGR